MKRGFGLVEVVVGASIILIFFFGLMNALAMALRLNQRNLALTQANFLLTEGVEAVKMLRNDSWKNNILPLSPSASYHLTWSGGKWQITTTADLIDSQFDRALTLGTAYRDSNQDLAASGTADPDSRLLTVTVSWWEHNATSTATTTTYVTNLFGS